MTRDEAIRIVQAHLDRHQPSAYRLQVVADASRQEDDWWIISVGADRQDIDRYDYYHVLTTVEQEIDDEENEPNISLAPAPSRVAD